MAFDWIFSDEFEKFYKRVKKLKNFMRIADKELLIDHFVELRRHFKQMKIMMPKLIKLHNAELTIINNIAESDYKKKLNKYTDNLGKGLLTLDNLMKNAIILIEEILRIRNSSQILLNKQKLITIISYIIQFLETEQRDSFELVKLEKVWKKNEKRLQQKNTVKVQIIGKLNNGWRLSDIQNVVNELGGEVQTNKGSHPYKIIFPKCRPIPLAESTPPFRLVREISSITGVENKILIVSFYSGELLSA